MSRTVKLVLAVAVFAVLTILIGQCAFNAGEWIGAH
jgi:hypothetical protein